MRETKNSKTLNKKGYKLRLVKEDKWVEKIKNFRFEWKRLTIIENEGLERHFMFIVLVNQTNKKMKVCGYSTYFFGELMSNRIETLEYHAKIIVLFLNYVMFEKYESYQIKDITELEIEHGNNFLRDYLQGRIGNENKTQETVDKAGRILTRFYFHLTKTMGGMKYLQKSDFYVGTILKQKKVEEYVESIFITLDSLYIPPQRIKHIPIDIFQEMLDVCDDFYPHLKLALCLQAFGGLRSGEVCNVTRYNTNYSMYHNDMGWFTIDLRFKVQMRTDGKNVGGIKKPRVQPIHPIFLSVFQAVWKEHMKLIEGLDNPYGAIFLNRDHEAMLQSSYDVFFKKIITIVIQRLSHKADFKSSSQAKMLMSGRIGTHVLRHFFTQFLNRMSKDTLKSPVELAYWRGDSSLDTAISYLAADPIIDEKIIEIQKSVYEQMSVSKAGGKKK